jgi:arabinose-5-phosphate isomerase
MLALGDALAMALMEGKGFSAEQFAENHPGGSLGFKLSRVAEQMHTGPGFILCPEDTPLRKVFSAMSQKETRGAAGIVDAQGNLLGIITDGDIRRRLENSADPLAGTAKDMMSKNPRTIDAHEIAEKALFLMEQFRINMLFVLDSQSSQPKKPVGLIHVHDLLREISRLVFCDFWTF